jgi:hypothetical protein
MPDSNTSKKKIFISVAIIIGVVGSYLGVFYITQVFLGPLSLADFLISKKTMKDHRSDLLEKIQRDAHFKDINAKEYIKELEKIISMDKKRNLGEWVSYKSFTPNVEGEYISTNDYGMRSQWNLREMVERARKNRDEGIRNIIVLGGSVAFGYGAVRDEQTIFRVLNKTLKEDRYEVFNLAQGGFTSFMDLFSLSTIGLYLEPDIIIVMEGNADTHHLVYDSKGGELAWGLFSGSEQKFDPEFALGFHYQNLGALLHLGAHQNRRVILALQPLSGFENNSTIEKDEKIKMMWDFYPRIREIMRIVAKENGAEFIDLSLIFKDETNASVNFFDKSHLTVTGQRKVAQVFAKTVRNPRYERLETIDFFRLRKKTIRNILEQDFSGKYKTVEDD